MASLTEAPREEILFALLESSGGLVTVIGVASSLTAFAFYLVSLLRGANDPYDEAAYGLNVGIVWSVLPGITAAVFIFFDYLQARGY